MRSKSARPQVERLEDRTVLSTLSGTIPAAPISNVSGSGSISASSTSILLSGQITTNGVTATGSVAVTPGSGGAITTGTVTPLH
jgi:hypothetical protein